MKTVADNTSQFRARTILHRRILDYGLFPLLFLFCLLSFAYIKWKGPFDIVPAEQEKAASALSSDDIPLNESTVSPSPIAIADTRTLRKENGVLGVYDYRGSLLREITLDGTFLRASDEVLLSEGILFSSESELQDFLLSLES